MLQTAQFYQKDAFEVVLACKATVKRESSAVVTNDLPSILDDRSMISSIRSSRKYTRDESESMPIVAEDVCDREVKARNPPVLSLPGIKEERVNYHTIPGIIRVDSRMRTRKERRGDESRSVKKAYTVDTDASSASDSENRPTRYENRPTRYNPNRYEELHRLGTQSLLLRRTLSYIQVMQANKRNIMFDISWEKKREKNKGKPPSGSSAASTRRSYELAKSRQAEGKKRREELAAKYEEMRMKESFDCVVAFNFSRLSQSTSTMSGMGSNPASDRSVKANNTRSGSILTSDTSGFIYDRLYRMSQKQQEAGKKRRDEIANRIRA